MAVIEELPPAPLNRSGWPWTKQSKTLPLTMSDGRPWPKITIITPSYNQGQFLEETIRSVLLQNYPNLEYIIIDGGSKDDSFHILDKYSQWLTYWVSEPDRGQSHALNKGFDLGTGEILAWINSDDLYVINAFKKVAGIMNNFKHNLLIGERLNIDRDGNVIDRQTISPRPVSYFQTICLGRNPFFQEAVFFRKSLWEKAGPFEERYSFVFDFDFFIKCLHFTKAITMPGTVLACWRHHDLQKCHPDRQNEIGEEFSTLLEEHYPQYIPALLKRLFWSLGKRTVRGIDKRVNISTHVSSFEQ